MEAIVVDAVVTAAEPNIDEHRFVLTDGVWCQCTHLTVFSAPGLPKIYIPNFKLLTAEKLLRNPSSLITLMVMTVIVIVLTILAKMRDNH